MAEPTYASNFRADQGTDKVLRVTSVRVTQDSTVIQDGNDHMKVATILCVRPNPCTAAITCRDPRTVKDLFNTSVSGTEPNIILQEVGPCGEATNSNFYHFLNARVSAVDSGGSWGELSDTNFTITAEDYSIEDSTTPPASWPFEAAAQAAVVPVP